MFDTGYWTIARFRGVPLRLHWTIPVGALLFSGLRFAPAFWAAFFGLILLHELGHAIVVRAFRHKVHAIDVLGFGGTCHWSGSATPIQRAGIAWGGVVAQATVLVATFALIFVLGRPQSLAGVEVVDVFTRTNLWLIALNLLPVPPLDGAEAWPLFRHLKERWKNRRPRPKGRSRDSVSVGGSRASSSGDPPPSPEVADMLRRIAEEARRARRGN